MSASVLVRRAQKTNYCMSNSKVIIKYYQTVGRLVFVRNLAIFFQDCAFMKHANDTALKVEFNGDYRICCCLDCCKRWYFTFNGVECGGPLAIDGLSHIHLNHGKTDTNIHKTTYIGGYCQGISAGTVRVGINVGTVWGRNPGLMPIPGGTP